MPETTESTLYVVIRDRDAGRTRDWLSFDYGNRRWYWSGDAQAHRFSVEAAAEVAAAQKGGSVTTWERSLR